MQNTNNNCHLILFSTNKIKTGLFKGAPIVENSDATRILGEYFTPSGVVNFKDINGLREQLQKTGLENSVIDQYIKSLKSPSSRIQAESRIKLLLAGQDSKKEAVSTPIFTVGNGIYAVHCLETPCADGKWISTLCNCVASLLDEQKKLASLFLFLHASDISGEESMGEAYKEVTSHFAASIQESKLSNDSGIIRVFLFHHVDNIINSILENYTQNESANIYTKLSSALEEDNKFINDIKDFESQFIIRIPSDEK